MTFEAASWRVGPPIRSQAREDAHDEEGRDEDQEGAERAKLDEGRLDVGELRHTARHPHHPECVHRAEHETGAGSQKEGLQDGGPIAHS